MPASIKPDAASELNRKVVRLVTEVMRAELRTGCSQALAGIRSQNAEIPTRCPVFSVLGPCGQCGCTTIRADCE